MKLVFGSLGIFLALSSPAYSEEFTGKMVCNPKILLSNGQYAQQFHLEGYDFDNGFKWDGAKFQMTHLDGRPIELRTGANIELSLSEANSTRATRLERSITSQEFGGKILLQLAFVYKDKIAPGNLSGLFVKAQHLNGKRIHASARDSTSFGKDWKLVLILNSNSQGVKKLELECFEALEPVEGPLQEQGTQTHRPSQR